MKRHGLIKFLAAMGALWLVAGCAYPMSQTLGDEARPNLALSLRTSAGPLQPIDATTPWRGFVDLSASGGTDYPTPWDLAAAFTIAHAGLQGFSTAC
jgi:hypothetical protein